jgi:hypothetical protein
MGSGARAILDQLEQRSWFSRAGLAPLQPAATVGSWEDAAASGCSHAWTDVLIGASNALAAAALSTPARRERWNALAAELKPRCARIVTAHVARSPLAAWAHGAALPDPPATAAEQQAMIDRAIAAPSEPSAALLLLGNLEWIALHAAIEAELCAKQPSGWFRRAAAWLADGHFLCGWRGDLTAGRPVVY